MAQEDFSAANTLAPGDRANTVDPDGKDRAAAAHVTDVAKIDYAEALAAFEARSDIEPLADRRAREAATTFAATDFVRSTEDGVGAGTTFNDDGTVDHDSNPATGAGV